jgi:hypothetical protein
MQAAAVEMSAGNAAGAAELVATLAPAPAVAGVTVHERWAYEIVDAEAVPRSYCSPDDAKIRKVLTNPMHGLIPQVPGIRFFLDGKVVVRK